MDDAPRMRGDASTSQRRTDAPSFTNPLQGTQAETLGERVVRMARLAATLHTAEEARRVRDADAPIAFEEVIQ